MQRQITAGIIVVILALTAIATTSQPIQSQIERGNEPVGGDIVEQQREFGIPDKLTGARLPGFSAGIVIAAPIAISGDNIYIAWPTNRTGNDEVNFRASTDGGTTFTDKINLSNSTDSDSQDVEIAADGDNVIITWWERNRTAEEPVFRMSTNNGDTFGPLLKLATNGTIGETAEEG